MSESSHFERRLLRVERSNRRLRIALAVLGGAAVLTFAGWRTAAPTVVRAEKFELVDPEGRVRGQLSLKQGNPGLYLVDAKGKQRVALWTDPQTTALYLNDGDGHTRVGTAWFPHGGGFALHGPKSKERP